MIGRLDAAGEHLLRESAPQVLGAVVRRFGDFAAAEDAVQEALLAASVQWPRDGVPGNPRAWLIQVASRRMADHVRAEVARRRRESAMAAEPESAAAPVASDGDDTLMLLFMCCHPALSASSAIALTLRMPAPPGGIAGFKPSGVNGMPLAQRPATGTQLMVDELLAE